MDKTDHVLIVDDDRDIRELVGTYLTRNGVRVTLASGGRQMRAALADERPDLIVLDLMLPGETASTCAANCARVNFRPSRS